MYHKYRNFCCNELCHLYYLHLIYIFYLIIRTLFEALGNIESKFFREGKPELYQLCRKKF